VNLEIAIWKEEAKKYGAMAESMMAISKMERRMEKVPSNGQMAINILEVGNKGNSME
jgi:hypothetical protein